MFSLEIKVEAFLTKDNDGKKKTYCKGKVVNWAAELGSLTFDLLLSTYPVRSVGALTRSPRFGSLTRLWARM